MTLTLPDIVLIDLLLVVGALLIGGAITHLASMVLDLGWNWLAARALSSRGHLIGVIPKVMRVAIWVGYATVATLLLDMVLPSFVVLMLWVALMLIAFAATGTTRNMIANTLFYLNRPVHKGQTLRVDQIEGLVERVGFWETTLLMPNGTTLHLPNGELAEKPLHILSESATCVPVICRMSIPRDLSPGQARSIAMKAACVNTYSSLHNVPIVEVRSVEHDHLELSVTGWTFDVRRRNRYETLFHDLFFEAVTKRSRPQTVGPTSEDMLSPRPDEDSASKQHR